MQTTVALSAGVTLNLAYTGRFFLLKDTGTEPSVSLRFRMPGQSDEDFQAARGFKLSVLAGFFDSIAIKADNDTTVEFVVSDNNIDADFVNGTTVNVTATTPLPVSNDRGTPANLMHVTGVSIADAPAVSATAGAAIPCSSVTAVLAAANASRRALRFYNAGPDPVAITPPGGTWAQRVIIVDAGGTYIEDRAANLAWSGICDAAKTASVTVQGILA